MVHYEVLEVLVATEVLHVLSLMVVMVIKEVVLILKEALVVP